MVRITEVQDESERRQYQGSSESRFAQDDNDSTDDFDGSDDSDDSDDDSDDDDVSERGLKLREETVWQRLAALQDIVPPTYRRWFSQKASTTASVLAVGGSWAGSIAWVVTTGAILVGLPYALASEEEAMYVRQEREFAQQQSGAQMLGGAPQPGQEQQQGGIRPPGF